MPREKKTIDLEKLEQLAQLCDNQDEIARALGMCPTTFYARLNESEEVKETLKRGQAKANIFVAGKLMEAIKAGNMTAIIFWLKCRAGWKESQQLDITSSDGSLSGNVQEERALSAVKRLQEIREARKSALKGE